MPSKAEKTHRAPRRRGGALVSEGAYGCVYAPALPCDRNAAGPHAAIGDALAPRARAKLAAAKLGQRPLVTKLFENDGDLHLEWDNAKVIAAVDPQQKYFIFALEQCPVGRAVAAKEKPAPTSRRKKCTLLDDDPTKNQYPAVTIPNGGRPLHHWLQANTGLALADLGAMLLPCMKGLALLARHRIIHQDMKANNVVVDADGAAKIIDFGLMTRFDIVFDSANPIAYKRYWVLPPEIRVARWLNTNRDLSLARHAPLPGATTHDMGVATDVATIVEELVEGEASNLSFTFGDHDIQSLRTLYNAFRPDEKAFKADMTRLYKRLARPKTKPEAALKKYASRMDVYGMGLLLMWAAQYTREWTAAPKSAALRDYMAFVARMIHPDPVKRVSMTTAIKEATAWLGKARG